MLKKHRLYAAIKAAHIGSGPIVCAQFQGWACSLKMEAIFLNVSEVRVG